MTGFPVGRAQTTPTHIKRTLAAGVAQVVVDANKALAGVRLLNWTASPVYLAQGVTTNPAPASTAPSDFLPAAVGGVPGQIELPYAPTGGLVAVGASSGDLTVVVW